MATRTPTVTHSGDGSVITVVWSGLLNGDDGAAVAYERWADRSIQVTGTFGAGGNMRWQGSNNAGASFIVLTDPQGTALNLGAGAIKAVSEITELAQPLVTAGDGTTDLVVTAVMRRANPMRT